MSQRKEILHRSVKILNREYSFRFNSSSHVYFVTVQKKSYLPGEAETGFVTRISRTCITDANFNTYSEVSLECQHGGENFNLLQAATTVTASKKVIGEKNDDGHNPSNPTSPEVTSVANCNLHS